MIIDSVIVRGQSSCIAHWHGASQACSVFGPSIRIQEMEELDKGIVWHLLTSIAELFSLDLYIVVTIVLVVTIIGLSLDRCTGRFRVQIVHVGEAHVAELSLVSVLGDVDLALAAVRVI